MSTKGKGIPIKNILTTWEGIPFGQFIGIDFRGDGVSLMDAGNFLQLTIEGGGGGGESQGPNHAVQSADGVGGFLDSGLTGFAGNLTVPFVITTGDLNASGTVTTTDLNASGTITGASIVGTNVTIPGSLFLDAIGATYPATGKIRLPYNGGASIPIIVVKDSTNTDRNFLTYGAANAWTIGNSSQNSTLTGTNVTLTAGTTLSGSCGALTLTASNDTSSFLAFGGSPAAAGIIRVPSAQANILMAGTKTVLSTTATEVFLGSSPTATNQAATVRVYPSNFGALGIAGVNYLLWDGSSSTIQVAMPRIGLNSGFSSEAEISIAVAVPGTTVLSAAQYSRSIIRATGTPGGVFTFQVPSVGAVNNAYRKSFRNETPSNQIISMGSGETTLIAPGQSEDVFVTTSGVFLTESVNPFTNEFRLTLSSGVPIPTGNVTAAGTVYLTPFPLGSGTGQIALRLGTQWVIASSAQVQLTLAGLVAGSNYDIFATLSSGSVSLVRGNAWTNDTTRSEALTELDGILVLQSDTTRRYVGTIRATGAATTEDSNSHRFCWNLYNQVLRHLTILDANSSWTYVNPNNVWRQVRASAANQFDFVMGMPTTFTGQAYSLATVTAGTAPAAFGTAIGIDTTVAPSNSVFGGSALATANGHGLAIGRIESLTLALGYHVAAWLETGQGAATTFTFLGGTGGGAIQTGMLGTIMA